VLSFANPPPGAVRLQDYMDRPANYSYRFRDTADVVAKSTERLVTIEDESPTGPLRPSSNRRGLWGIGALVVIVLIMAAIAYWNSSPTSSTATGPNTMQSAPSATGQGGVPNTGAARQS
jgi:hypothetical protein